jgi:hypothetical protein
MTDPDAPLDDEPGRHAADEPAPGLLERWQATEPIRVALYPIAATVVALLVGYGLLTPERAPLWLNVVAAITGGALPVIGAELARRQAWSPATVRATVDEWREHEYAEGYTDATELAERHAEVKRTGSTAAVLPPPTEPAERVDLPTTAIPAQHPRGVPPRTT